jgi:hypothetical protein
MNSLLRWLLPVFLTSVLWGCAIQIPLQRSQVDSFRLGETAQAIKEKIGKSTPTLEHPVEYQGKTYTAQHFNLQTGVQHSSTVVCVPHCIFIPITVPIYTAFVVVSSNETQRVVTFGTIEELSKSPDNTIADMMPVLKAAMEKARAQAKKAG